MTLPTRRGFTLLEALIALALVSVQVPAIFATVTAATTLARRAQVIVAAIDPAAAVARCEAP